MQALDQLAAQGRERVDRLLNSLLTQHAGPDARLQEALAYSLLNGGKRLRPLLVYATGRALQASWEACDASAMAVELVHAYSLVHDDLPAMDDDDLRRGRPTCHKAFDEATAILVGDALQTLAFQVLANSDPQTAIKAIQTLAQASGAEGMVGGQMLDLQAEGQQLTLEQLERLHGHKTGALIRASVRLGGLAAQATAGQLASLDAYADALGLAFQVQDDLLDVKGDASKLGKNTGADALHLKATYPGLLGVEAAEQKAKDLIQLAKASLEPLPGDWTCLMQLADWCIQRDH